MSRKSSRKPRASWAIPTIRIGLDGTWMGATRSSSYFPFSVEPGDPLCTNWQSRLERFSREAAFTSLTAEPRQRYYFSAPITDENNPSSGMSLDLDPVNPDKGEFS